MKDLARKKIAQKYYSERAKDYDRQKIRTWKSKEGFGAEVIDGVIEALTGLTNKPVLEVGVGSGRIGLPLLERVNPWFVGLDFSKEMLKLARTKMTAYKQKFDLILGDAEHLPFASKVFSAMVCISTMHYFASPETSLAEFSRAIKEGGVFVYGDLTMHESDNRNFLDALERMLSGAHAKYYKPSEMQRLLTNEGFQVSKADVVPYRKSYSALIEDKGRYFDVNLEALRKCVRKADANEKRLYDLDNEGLTLFYTLITALEGNDS